MKSCESLAMLLKVCERKSVSGGMWAESECPVLEGALSIANGNPFVDRSCQARGMSWLPKNLRSAPIAVRAAAASCKRLGEEWKLVGEFDAVFVRRLMTR